MTQKELDAFQWGIKIQMKLFELHGDKYLMKEYYSCDDQRYDWPFYSISGLGGIALACQKIRVKNGDRPFQLDIDYHKVFKGEDCFRECFFYLRDFIDQHKNKEIKCIFD